ncbi:MAG: hypothetical protein IRD7MM_05210 [Candidatus Midichloria mitochondrii]
MLAIDIQDFRNSDEFRSNISQKDMIMAVDKAEAISIGWLFVLLSDIAMIICTYSPICGKYHKKIDFFETFINS